METGKVFMCGRSQAVRIPRKLRFRTAEVTIQVKGDSLLLTPRQTRVTWEEFFARHTHPDFELERDEAPPQTRELL